jgi:hypothetical protein
MQTREPRGRRLTEQKAIGKNHSMPPGNCQQISAERAASLNSLRRSRMEPYYQCRDNIRSTSPLQTKVCWSCRGRSESSAETGG